MTVTVSFLLPPNAPCRVTIRQCWQVSVQHCVSRHKNPSQRSSSTYNTVNMCLCEFRCEFQSLQYVYLCVFPLRLCSLQGSLQNLDSVSEGPPLPLSPPHRLLLLLEHGLGGAQTPVNTTLTWTETHRQSQHWSIHRQGLYANVCIM